MIYLSDDYLTKYSDTLSYLIGRANHEGFSFDYIEKMISYSIPINEFEKSNVTQFAFSSMEKLYSEIFPTNDNDYTLDVYGIFGWVGYTYMHLFLTLEITFEAIFFIIPINEMLNLYHLYHEMDFNQMLDYVKEKTKYSLLDVIMKRKNCSNKDLSNKTKISVSTINAIRYGKRDISKLEADQLLLISHFLNVKMETLLPNIHLNK